MTRPARQRPWIAAVAIACLLLQQAALAAYLCPVDTARVAMSTMASGCVEMNTAHVGSDPALCAKHCHPEQTSAADAAKLSVPPLALPPMLFSTMAVQTSSRSWADVPIVRSDPPPRLQYCSLLM
jgi:hypothetical protein